MKTLAQHRQLRFGMRTAKSALSVALALALSYAIGSAYPAFMAIGALGSMERSITSSIRSARNQIAGNLFGALLATAFIILFNNSLLPAQALPLVTGLGTILMLCFCNAANIQSAANLSCVVFVCLMVDIHGGAPLTYGFSRCLDTILGVLIALSVNIVIRPYNCKPHTYSMLRATQTAMLPLLEQRVLRCRIPSLDDMNNTMDHVHHEIRMVAHEKYNVMLTRRDIAHIRGCEQLLTKMHDALISICSLDATPAPNDENLARLYALGLEKTGQDNFLDGKCTFEDRVVLNYYLKLFLDANDYLSELMEL